MKKCMIKIVLRPSTHPHRNLYYSLFISILLMPFCSPNHRRVFLLFASLLSVVWASGCTLNVDMSVSGPVPLAGRISASNYGVCVVPDAGNVVCWGGVDPGTRPLAPLAGLVTETMNTSTTVSMVGLGHYGRRVTLPLFCPFSRLNEASVHTSPSL